MEPDKTIEVFDIDDTLLTSKSKIYYTLPGDTEEIGCTSAQFAEIRASLPKGTNFDFREYNEFQSVYAGITKGKPNLHVLRKMDQAIKAGHKIGILTARGNQSAVLASIKDTLLFKDKRGTFKKIPRKQFRKRWVWACSDDKTEPALQRMGAQGNGRTSPEVLKAFVLQKIIADKEGFTSIIFYDDDMKNIKAVQDLNDPRITAIKV